MRCYDLLSLHPLNWCLPLSLCCLCLLFFAVPMAAISASQAATKRGCVQSPHQRWRSPKLQSLDRKDSQNITKRWGTKGEQHAFEKIIEFRLSSKSSNFNSKWNFKLSYHIIILCFSKISKINELSCSKAHRTSLDFRNLRSCNCSRAYNEQNQKPRRCTRHRVYQCRGALV